MGCITSRAKWPPDPAKHAVVRWEKQIVDDGSGKLVSKLVQVTDYQIAWPSLKCSASSRDTSKDDECDQ